MEEKIYPKIQIVDESDNLIDEVGYFEAIEMGAIRRAARVFVFADSGEFLIQKRSQHVNIPLLLDHSVGGHVDEGETYMQAAEREMNEELGLVGYELTLIAASYRTPNFFSNIYKTVINRNQKIDFDPHEVESVHWMSPEEVDALVRDTPELCTDSLVLIWPDIRSKLLE